MSAKRKESQRLYQRSSLRQPIMILKDIVALQTVLILLIVSNDGKAEKNQRCYVCVPKSGPTVAEVTQMFPEGPKVPSCDRFDEGEAYIRECPSSANYGCLTQTEGTRMTKTCSDIDIEDCKTANKITYCYCKGDLCNRERESSEADDEDLGADKFSEEDQGSGFSATVTEEDIFSPREFSTTGGSTLLPTTTEANVLATTLFSSEGKRPNASSRQETFLLFVSFFLVVLFRLR